MVTLSYMASWDWVQDAEMELGEKFAEETGIKIDYQIVPSDQYSNLLMTRLEYRRGKYDMFGSQSGKFGHSDLFECGKERCGPVW